MSRPVSFLARRAESTATRVAAGLLFGFGAVAAKGVLSSLTGEDVAYLPVFAVLVPAAVIGGRLGGLTCALGAALVDAIFIQAPFGSADITDPAAFVRFVLFLPIASLIVVLLADIDDHRRGAASAVDRFQALVAALPDPTILVDGRRHVTYANEAVGRVGVDAAALIGHPLDRIVHIPDGAERSGSRGTSETLELLADDGTEVPVDATLRAVTLPDGQPGSIVTLRDARPRLEDEIQLIRLARAERQRTDALRTVVASLSDGVGLFDREGVLIVANDALTRLAGRPIGHRHELPAEWLTGHGAAIASGDPSRWLRTAVYQLDEEGGSSTLVVATDETASIEAAGLRDAFIGVMSHELRTPVTSVLAAAHLLERRAGTLDPTSAELAEDIRAESTRLNELIEDLLVLSRAQIGAMVVDLEPVLVQRAIAEVVQAEGNRYPRVAFETDIEARLPPVRGDHTYVGQILRNLIGNAGKYSLDDPAVVTVVARADGDEVIVRVLDRGPGFDPSLAGRLFDIYFRAESTAKARSGSGIGLYVSRTLVEALDGRIWASPREGGGSEFGFSLPIDRSDDGMDTIAALDTIGLRGGSTVGLRGGSTGGVRARIAE